MVLFPLWLSGVVLMFTWDVSKIIFPFPQEGMPFRWHQCDQVQTHFFLAHEYFAYPILLFKK